RVAPSRFRWLPGRVGRRADEESGAHPAQTARLSARSRASGTRLDGVVGGAPVDVRAVVELHVVTEVARNGVQEARLAAGPAVRDDRVVVVHAGLAEDLPQLRLRLERRHLR